MRGSHVARSSECGVEMVVVCSKATPTFFARGTRHKEAREAERVDAGICFANGTSTTP